MHCLEEANGGLLQNSESFRIGFKSIIAVENEKLFIFFNYQQKRLCLCGVFFYRESKTLIIYREDENGNQI